MIRPIQLQFGSTFLIQSSTLVSPICGHDGGGGGPKIIFPPMSAKGQKMTYDDGQTANPRGPVPAAGGEAGNG
jgi:hypothetical protein